MTRQRPVSRSAIAQIVAAAAVVALLVLFLGWVHGSAPQRPLEPILEGAQDPAGEALSLLTCRRVLPDRPPVGAQEQAVPLGLVRSSEVVSCPDIFDPEGTGGPVVQYVGEIVGDVLVREDGAWTLMNDDGYALEEGPLTASGRFHGTNSGLAVWLPDDVVDVSALEPGRPGRRGDVLQIQGRVHRVDPRDGGGLTLRAIEAEIVVEAVPAEAPLHVRLVAAAAGLAAVALGLVLYERRRRIP